MHQPVRKPLIHTRTRCSILLPDASVQYWPGFLGTTQAAQLCEELLTTDEIVWRHDKIKMFGREVLQPRLSAWIADPGISYSYSGLALTPASWPATLTRLRQQLELQLAESFNSVLINLYRDGNDYMGWHRDNESQLGAEPVIASLSLGETRRFDLRHRAWRDRNLATQRFELRSGDLLVMSGTTQQHWHHRVSRQKALKGPRLNLSFRHTAGVRPQ